MPITPEDSARIVIDNLLEASGRAIQDMKDINIMARLGVAVREFPIPGQGLADYLLYIDGKAIGVIEAKKEGDTLTGVEIQSAKYSKNFPDWVDYWKLPLPFSYQSTGTETRFTNHLEPDARSREVFAFHKPETLHEWVQKEQQPLSLLRSMPDLITRGLRAAQIEAITNLEISLADNRPKALIQMATGSGKTFTACNFMYRLIKFGGAKRILFLVDRGNLGRQTSRCGCVNFCKDELYISSKLARCITPSSTVKCFRLLAVICSLSNVVQNTTHANVHHHSCSILGTNLDYNRLAISVVMDTYQKE